MRSNAALFQPNASYMKTSLNTISGLITETLPDNVTLESLTYLPSAKQYSDAICITFACWEYGKTIQIVLNPVDFPTIESLSKAILFHNAMLNLQFNHRGLGIRNHNYTANTVTFNCGDENILVDHLERFFDKTTNIFNVDACKTIINAILLERYETKLQSRCLLKAPQLHAYEPGFKPGTFIEPHFKLQTPAVELSK